MCWNMHGILFTILYALFVPTLPASLTHRLTPCAKELGDVEHVGRYPQAIANEFKDDAVVPAGPRRNLFCICDTRTRMSCWIRMRPNSRQEIIITRRLQSTDLTSSPSEDLKPFFILHVHYNNPSAFDPPVYFELPNCEERVICELYFVYNPDVPLRRSESSPGSLTYPDKFITLQQCTDGCEDTTCPITHDSFHVHDLVFVLKSEVSKLKSGSHVCCISFKGMDQLEQSSIDFMFRDPLRRTGDQRLERDDYELFVVTKNPTPGARAEGNETESSSNVGSQTPEPKKVALTARSVPIQRPFDFYIMLLLVFTFFLIIYHFVQPEEGYYIPRFTSKKDMYIEFEEAYI